MRLDMQLKQFREGKKDRFDKRSQCLIENNNNSKMQRGKKNVQYSWESYIDRYHRQELNRKAGKAKYKNEHGRQRKS
jgi:hypothetical protein